MKIGEEDAAIYPKELISTIDLSNGNKVTIRPVKVDDKESLQDFIRHLSNQNKHSQFMENFKELSSDVLKRMTQIDYDQEMVLLATCHKDGKEMIIGMARYIVNPDKTSCESIIVVADAWQNQKIGRQLLDHLTKIAKSKGFIAITGLILASNVEMIELVKHVGFTISNSDDPTMKNAIKTL
ncbi:MAG: GNAT family N-acetyltransferase [Gammaproteobacteria bacterium]|nr:GNAT family N-acetyltransferase [Gammaproteobacteria bacterium]